MAAYFDVVVVGAGISGIGAGVHLQRACPGIDSYQGTVVHPQAWPDDLDYRGKRVVVIGSGATAMTLVPALVTPDAPMRAAHVTMLQRSPTYVASRPAKDALANRVRKVLPERLAYRLIRTKNVAPQQFFYAPRARTPRRPSS